MEITAVLWTSSCYTYIVNQGYIKIHLTTCRYEEYKISKHHIP